MNSIAGKPVPLFRLRLISLFLALLLWVLFSGRMSDVSLEESMVSRVLEVPIAYTSRPSEMEIKQNISQVLITVSGKDSEMKSLRGDMMMVKLDLNNLGSGRHQVPIADESVEVPPDYKSLKIEAINPRFLWLDAEKKIRKTLKVVVRPKGVPAQDFALQELVVTPKEVQVYGPESKVKDLSFLIGEPVDISGLAKDVKGRVVFDYDTQFPKNTTMEGNGDLEYHAIITEKTVTREFGKMKPVFDGWEPKLKFKPRSIRVSIQGPVTVVKQVKKEWLQIIIPQPPEEEVPDQLLLGYKWNPPPPEKGPEQEQEPQPGTLEWTVLSRMEELEVLMNPAQVEVKK